MGNMRTRFQCGKRSSWTSLLCRRHEHAAQGECGSTPQRVTVQTHGTVVRHSPSGQVAALALKAFTYSELDKGKAPRTQSLSEIAPNQIGQEKFRLKPKFREPLQGKPWVWNPVSTASATLEFKTKPRSTGSLWPEAGTDTCSPGSRARRPNHFYSHRMARHSTKGQDNETTLDAKHCSLN